LILILLITLLAGGVHSQDENRVLRMAFTEEPEMLVDYFSNTLLAIQLYRMHSQPQWGMTGSSEVVPILLDELPSYENGGVSQTADGKTVVKFTLADFAVWSDGTPITADDFVLPYDIGTDGVSAMLSYQLPDDAQAVVAQGETDKDVVITFPGAFPDWYLADIVPMPAHILREPYEAGLAEGKGFDTNELTSGFLRAPMVSDGPFVFDEWVTGSYIRFVKNPNYWKDVWFDEVQLNFYQDATVIEQLVASGEIDYTGFILPPSRAAEFAAEHEDIEVLGTFASLRLELKLNLGPNGHPALKDVRVRKAIGMAIDRQFIVDEIYNGLTKITNSLWGDTIWYNEDIPVLPYDPEGAKALLKEAGWYDENGDGVAEAHGVEGAEEGTPLQMTATTYADIQHYEDSLLYLQDALADIGLKFDITMYPISVMHGSLSSGSPYATGQHDLYLQAWIPGLSTIDMFDPYDCDEIPTEEHPSGWNGVQVCDARVDELWDLLGTSLDDAERQAAADEIQYIIADQALTLYLVNVPFAITYNKRLVFEDHSASDITPWLTINDWHFTE
jgi:peptide/nickel transport system substrate-binding protein